MQGQHAINLLQEPALHPAAVRYGNKSKEDILLEKELDAWARAYPDRLKVVHVLGDNPDAKLPAGFKSTSRYTAEGGHGRPLGESFRICVRHTLVWRRNPQCTAP